MWATGHLDSDCLLGSLASFSTAQWAVAKPVQSCPRSDRRRSIHYDKLLYTSSVPRQFGIPNYLLCALKSRFCLHVVRRFGPWRSCQARGRPLLAPSALRQLANSSQNIGLPCVTQLHGFYQYRLKRSRCSQRLHFCLRKFFSEMQSRKCAATGCFSSDSGEAQCPWNLLSVPPHSMLVDSLTKKPGQQSVLDS